MKVFFSAGEASGDMLAAKLLAEIKRIRPGLTFQVAAIGGRKLASTGALMVADSSRWGAISISESIKVFPRVLRSYFKARRALRYSEPGLFVPIDFGFLNVRLARYARGLNWRVLYFMPPGSWRRTSHGEALPEVTDEIVTPFSWSSSYLGSIGGHVHWYGHPLRQIVAEHTMPEPRDDMMRVAILPGSRSHEVNLNMSVIAKAVEKLPMGIALEFAVASSIPRSRIVELWKRHSKSKRSVVFTEGDTVGVLKRARAAIVCSGSATLEASLCQCPMVVIYRLSKSAALEAKLLRVRPQFISLPNIVLNRSLVPELVHKAATGPAIASWIMKLTEDGPDRENQLLGFQQIENELGPVDAITKTAALAVSLM